MTTQVTGTGINFNGSTSGTIVLTQPAIAGSNTITLPAETSTLATQAYVTTASALRSYLAGLTLSAAGATATFGIAAGMATGSTNATTLTLASAFTKTTSAWVAGTGNGGIDTGAIANATWYHVYLISTAAGATVDVIFSTNATSPTLPATYTLYRRIGSMLTNGSAQWVKFFQNGDDFDWDVPVLDLATTLSGASQLLTLSVPLGVKTNAQFSGHMLADPPNRAVLFWAPDTTGAVPGVGGISTGVVNNATYMTVSGNSIRTNTSSQIRCYGPTQINLWLTTMGWTDRRGRDA